MKGTKQKRRGGRSGSKNLHFTSRMPESTPHGVDSLGCVMGTLHGSRVHNLPRLRPDPALERGMEKHCPTEMQRCVIMHTCETIRVAHGGIERGGISRVAEGGMNVEVAKRTDAGHREQGRAGTDMAGLPDAGSQWEASRCNPNFAASVAVSGDCWQPTCLPHSECTRA